MLRLIPLFFGLITGLVVGFGLAYLGADLIRAEVYRGVIGAVAGAIFGAVIGSISGEMNATADVGGHKLVIAGIAGAIGGMLGATKLEPIWLAFRYFDWPTPI